ncbi:MAG: HAD family hydrolase [Solirubrobacteraceae bacterium]
MSQSAPALVIFDCDGVLVDSESISNDLLARMLSDEGLPTTPAQSRREYQGLLLIDILTSAEARLGRALPEGWMDRYEQERSAAFRKGLRPVKGVAAAIEQIREAGVSVCVASQGKLEKTRLSLQLTGLDTLFEEEALFSAYQVLRGKPHPDLFLHAARTMGADPSKCVVIEDTPSGVQAAVAAGMRVLGFSADSDEQALRGAGAETFGALDALPGLLGVGGRPSPADCPTNTDTWYGAV